MSAFLLCVSVYALWHLSLCVWAMWRDHYPRKCSLGLYALGLWAAYLLAA